MLRWTTETVPVQCQSLDYCHPHRALSGLVGYYRETSRVLPWAVVRMFDYWDTHIQEGFLSSHRSVPDILTTLPKWQKTLFGKVWEPSRCNDRGVPLRCEWGVWPNRTVDPILCNTVSRLSASLVSDVCAEELGRVRLKYKGSRPAFSLTSLWFFLLNWITPAYLHL